MKFRRLIVILILTSVVVACSTATHKRSAQAEQLRYRELYKILPVDADRSRMPEQETAIQRGMYYRKDGKLVPLRADSDPVGSPALQCRSCENQAPQLNDKKSNKHERLEPYIIKVE